MWTQQTGSDRAGHDGKDGQGNGPGSDTNAPELTEAARALQGVGRDIASARGHLRLLQDGFERSESELDRARGLVEEAQRNSGSFSAALNKQEAPISPLVSVNLMGTFRAVVNSTEVEHWNGSKARALFIYLVSHRNSRVPREQLHEALWPGGDVEAAANSLRVAVHGLRLAMTSSTRAGALLRDSFVVFEKGAYAINPTTEFVVDSEQFERRWNRGRRLEVAGDAAGAALEYELAEATYVGDFLQDEPYEEWSMLRREGLKDMYLSVLSRLSARAYATGDYEGCILRCQKLIAADTCREDTYQMLIRSHARLRQPGRARRWYEICVQVLKDELDVPPSQQTEDAYQEIFHQRAN